ncbi:MAG: sigma-70 family RNA polymerase sigma factor [Planctomycetota bacterium]
MDPDAPTPEEQMARFQRHGDADAFGALVDRFLQPALGVARQMLPDHAMAEDAVQDAFLRVIRKRDQYDPARPFAAWFYTVLRNICRDKLRRRGREKRALQAQAAVQDVVAPPPPDGPEPDFPGLRLLDRLPERERAVLRLRIVHDMPFRDIAAALGISHEAAKKRGQRGLRHLRGLARSARAS